MRKFVQFTSILVLILGLYACAGTLPNINLPNTPPPPPPLKVKPPRVALVLGSGGARGYAHLGVLQVLQKAGVPIDLIVGASAGSFVGSLFADNESAQKTYQIMMKAGFWDLADVSNVPSMSGVIQGYHYEKFLLHNMQAKTFRQLKIKLLMATTDLNTGKTYVIQSGPVAPAALASAAIPGAVRPIKLYGHVLIDGGVAAPVPVAIAKRYHPKIIIAVNISEQLQNDSPYTAVGILSRANSIMWKHLTKASEKGANIIIRPNVGQTGTFDMSRKHAMYLDGVKAARAELPSILKLLKAKHIPLKK